jgi:MFS family permease
VGTAFSLPLLGKIVDSRGPRILLVCAFIFLISGYLGMKFFYDSGLPPEEKSLPNLIFAALIVCLFLVGSGGSSAYTAAVNTTAKNFPDKVVSVQVESIVNLAVNLAFFVF